MNKKTKAEKEMTVTEALGISKERWPVVIETGEKIHLETECTSQFLKGVVKSKLKENEKAYLCYVIGKMNGDPLAGLLIGLHNASRS